MLKISGNKCKNMAFIKVNKEREKRSPRSTAGHLRFRRTKRSLRAFQLDNSGEEDPMDLDPNDVYAVQYNSIKPLVYSRQIGLV
ncbi:hypothetical protein ACSBR2_031464 [Camellia fascicularis]